MPELYRDIDIYLEFGGTDTECQTDIRLKPKSLVRIPDVSMALVKHLSMNRRVGDGFFQLEEDEQGFVQSAVDGQADMFLSRLPKNCLESFA